MNFGFLIPSGYAVSLPGDGRRMQILAQAAAMERLGHRVTRLNGWDNSQVEEIDALHIVEGAFGNSVGAMGRPFGIKLMGLAPFIDSNQPNWRYRMMAWLGSRHPQLVTAAGFYHRQMGECDVILVRSSHESARVVKGIGIPASKVKVVLNGVDLPAESDPELARRHFNLPKEYLLHVSLYSEPRKNVLRLLEAVASTRLPLVIAGNPSGDTAMLGAIQAAIAKMGNVHLLGFLEPRMLQSLYAGCRVFCLPSLHEGTGLVALEAAAHGAGVVITRNGGPPDYFKDLAYYVDPVGVGDIRDTILQAWEKPQGAELRAHVLSSLTWDQSARSLAAAYGAKDNA